MPKFFDLTHFGKKATNSVTIYGSVITLSGSSGTANITINGYLNSTVATYSSSLTTTASNWVADNYSYYYALGYVVSAASGVITVSPRYGWDTVNRIIATIANATGDLAGTLTGKLEVDFAKSRIWKVTFGQNITILAPRNAKDGDAIRLELKATGAYTVTWTAAAWYFVGGTEPSQTSTSTDVVEGVFSETFEARYDVLSLTGSSGTANITMGGLTKLLTYDTSISNTIDNFLTANTTAFAEVGLTLSKVSTTGIKFLVATDAAKWYAQPSIVNVSGNLDGSNVNYPAGRVLVRPVMADVKQ